MTQEEFGKLIGKSRWWTGQLEKGSTYTGDDFHVSPDMCVKIALVLNLSAPEVLRAAGIPETDWPDLSHIRSIDASVKTIDITTLSTNQTRLIEDLIEEFKAANNGRDTGDAD